MPEQSKSLTLSGIHLEKNNAPKKNPLFPQWVFLMLLGMTSTVVMVLFVRGLEDQTARSEFATAAEQRMVLLDSSIQRSVDSLFAIGAFFDASPSVSRSQFRNLVVPILNRQKSLQALSWDPVLAPNEIKPLVAFTRSEGLSDFDIYELGVNKNKQALSARSEYFPVWFIEPMKGNEKALGFDLGSNSARMASIELARKQQRPIATSRITLVQETTKQFGFLLLRPVYANNSAIGTRIAPGLAPAKEIGQLRGFISGVFRIGQMLEMQDQNKIDSVKPMQIYLFDTQGKPGEQILYPQEGGVDSVEKLPDIAIKRTIQVGGRTWVAAATPFANSYSVDRTSSCLVVLAGLLLTILGTALQRQASGKANSIEKIVTERTKALQESEQSLMRANQESQEASRMKTVFLASMSHEFRTPMNAVLGLLHVLSHTPLNDSQKDYVIKITGAAKRLLRLIEDILDVSRIEAGKLSLENTPFLIESVFRDVLVAVSPKLRESKVELIFDIDPSLPVQLLGDAMRLTQVMVNLVDNAAKFTSEGQIVISVRSDIAAERRINFHVVVKDTGVGMPQSECDRLFQPFVQAESINRKRYGGTGLGLAICRQLVELMGGEIQATSILGEGSQFRFSVPLGVVQSQSLCARCQEVAGQSILLLEMHELSGASLERTLESMGAKVTRITSDVTARAALEVFEGSMMLIAEGFPNENELIQIAGNNALLRVVVLSSPGASVRDASKHYEKPLLPHTIKQIFSLDKLNEKIENEQSKAALPQPLIRGEENGQASDLIQAPLEPMRPELIEQLHALKALLTEGDPQAEQSARELVKMSEGTELNKFANSILIQCNNYDFREALASLDEVLPLREVKEKIK